MADRRRGPRFARLARVGTRVVVNGDSMYRGMSGTVVEPSVLRTARLDGFNRRRLTEPGVVLVEQSNGALFVAPTYVLGRSV